MTSRRVPPFSMYSVACDAQGLECESGLPAISLAVRKYFCNVVGERIPDDDFFAGNI
ncbi:hypothetical protein BSTEL_0396 [Bifidobacterium stellenboschense]|uniref:Uncharacterized protein n=1 Tax=Bifidobacterium stellenboschense TaxID=762211 RepID=A0A087DZN3_9BIFI|nr:hypothetical protein BSTEL_0396 [Bifidobacterium stellenboschense]